MQVAREIPFATTPPLVALTSEFNRLLGSVFAPDAESSATDTANSPLAAFQFETHAYYPQMIAWTVAQITRLVRDQGVAPRQIAVVAPYLNNSLRFSLAYGLEQAGIRTLSHRPSRALRDEPAVRTLITLARLAYPVAADLPPPADVADALGQAIGELDHSGRGC